MTSRPDDPHLDRPPVTAEDWIDALRSATDLTERSDLREEFARFMDPTVKGIASTVCTAYHESYNRFWNDALSTTQGEFLALTDELIADDTLVVRSFAAMVTRRAKREFGKFLNTSAGRNPASGMTGLQRRRQILARVERQLAEELGRPVGEVEILDRANSEARRRLKDPRRQGMVFTLQDLQPVLSPAELPSPETLGAPVDEEGPLTCEERKRLARLVIERVEAEGIPARVRVVHLLWDSQLTDAPEEFATIDLVAAEIDVSRTQARVLHDRLTKTLPREVLVEHFGISGMAS